MWSGLGYYSRARNLRRAAQAIVAAGGFPRDRVGLLALPGAGEYTAAAVGSIAFGLPLAVVDGNVLRVVARVENDAADIGAGATRARFREIAQAWLDVRDPARFNQALMELGATVCLPRNPQCTVCPLAACCQARVKGTAAQLPVKLRKTEPVRLNGVLLVVRRGERILLRQREASARRMAGFQRPRTFPMPHSARHSARFATPSPTTTTRLRSAPPPRGDPKPAASPGLPFTGLVRFRSALPPAKRSNWRESFTTCDCLVKLPAPRNPFAFPRIQ